MDVRKFWTTFTLIFFCAVPSVLCLSVLDSFSMNDTDNLSNILLKNYKKNTRGTSDQTGKTTLQIEFSVTSINGFDEVTGTFSVVGYFTIYWNDARMKWDPSQHNNIQYITFSQSDVWVPIIVHANSNGDNGIVNLGRDWMLVRYFHDGTAVWFPGDLFKSYCAPVIRDYPYDTQVCELQFIPWGYSPYEISFQLSREDCNTDLFVTNGAWNLTKTSVSKRQVYDAFELLSVEFTLKRRATFFLVNMILPIGLMGALNLLVFLLPPESGERVGFSITLLLAISVFLTIASSNLPKTSHPEVSFLCVKLLIDVLISSFVVLFTIIGLRFYHKDPATSVPSWTAALTRCILCRCCNRSKVRQSRKDSHLQSNDNSPYHINGKLPRIRYESTRDDEEEKEQDGRHSERPVTWTDVGKASDAVFFIITLASFAASHISYIIYIRIV